jgi:hypothetical protein
MKLRKIICAVIVALAAGVPCWAQITFSSWGRVVITPLAFTRNEQIGETYSAASAATSTWGDAPYISFTANGKSASENIGFNIDFDFGYNVTNSNYNIVGDNAKVWLHPLGLVFPDQKKILKLVAGRFNEDELRGGIGATEFGSWVLPNGSRDEDNIFTRVKATAGAYARVEPLIWMDSPWNQLTLHLAFGSNALGALGNALRAPLNLYNNEANQTNGEGNSYNDGWGEYDGDRMTSAADVYKAGQFAIGYKIPDIGLARFQFIGSNNDVWRMDSVGTISTHTRDDIAKRLVTGIDRSGNGGMLEAAFQYTGYKGLKVDIGYKFPLAYTTDQAITVVPPIYDPDAGITVTGWTNGKKTYDFIVQQPMVVALGANWTPNFLPNLTVLARFDCSFGGQISMKDPATPNDDVWYKNGPIINVWLVPSYKLNNIFTLGLDIGIDVHTGDSAYIQGRDREEWKKVTSYNDFGVAPWTDIQLGGGRVRVGVVIMFPGSFRDKADGTTGQYVTPKFMGDPVISVPVSITYSF